MDLKEARKLFKQYAALKYNGSRYILLQALIEGTYRGKNEVDVVGRTFTVKTRNLQKIVPVRGQQLVRLLKTIDEVQEFVREDGEITYLLDLSRLLEGADSRKAEQKKLNRKRTEDARAKKAKQRHEQKVPSVQQFFRDLQERNRLRGLEFNKLADCAEVEPAAVEPEVSAPASAEPAPEPPLVRAPAPLRAEPRAALPNPRRAGEALGEHSEPDRGRQGAPSRTP